MIRSAIVPARRPGRPLVLLVALLGGASVDSTAQGTLVRRLDGTHPGSAFGSAVAVTGDLDGDGLRDVAVGSPLAGPRGRVQVFSSATGDPLLSWSGAVSLTPIGRPVLERLGATLAATSEDGLTRLLVGAPASDWQFLATTQDAGAAAALWIAPPRVVAGSGAPAAFGSVVAGIGDVDGDRVPDTLVGAPQFAQAGLTVGQVHVVSGRTGGILRRHTGSRTLHRAFGSALCGLGDVDLDGVPDYAIGDPEAGVGGTRAGSVQILSGAQGTVLRSLNGNPGDRFGAALSGAPKLSLGFQRALAIGAPGADLGPGLSAAGYVRVLVPATGALLFTFQGSAANEEFGSALAAGHDRGSSLTGSDLLVGCPGSTVNGFPAAGRVRAFNLTSGSPVRDLPNPFPGLNDRFGSALSAARPDSSPVPTDLEVLVGSPQDGRSQGAAFLFRADGTLAFAITSALSGDHLGTAVAHVGDVDGDDRPDLAVGAPGANGGAGTVTWYSGATGAVLRTRVGQPGERLGASLSGVGNPARGEEFACGVLMGSPGAERMAATALCQPEVLAIGPPATTPATGGRAGSALAFLGDLNGDGVTDFALGAPDESPNARAQAGRVAFFSGRDLAPIRTLDGTAAGDHFGAAIAATGDLDFDQRADLAIGAPGADLALLGRHDVGRVSFVSSALGAVLHGHDGFEAGEALGSSLATLGDVDGDGVIDVASGAPGFDGFLGQDVGRVRFLSGRDGSAIRTLTGAANGDAFGATLASGGDLDGDGRCDLLVGLPLTALPGLPELGRAELYSGGTGQRLEVFTGATVPFEHLGAAVALGDVNGDCLADGVLGAPGANTGTGAVRLVSRVGLANQSAVFGRGCPGAGGFVPRIATFGGTPTSQGAPAFGVALTCAHGVPGLPALLLLGVSDTQWNGVPLPLDLGPLGLVGCSILVSGDLTSNATIQNGGGAGRGLAFLALPIPRDPALTGAVVFAQWMVADPGAPNGLLAFSNGLRVTVLQTP